MLVFKAISKLSKIPEKRYKEAKENQDLHLGDAHLIKINDNLYVINCMYEKINL